MPKIPERERKEKQAVVLARYEETASLTQACRHAGISTQTHRQWLGNDSEYARQFEACRARMAIVGRTYKAPGRPRSAKRKEDQRKFLEAFAQCGEIVSAGEVAGVYYTRHYVWLRDDPEYAERFTEVAQESASIIEDAKTRRYAKRGNPVGNPGPREATQEKKTAFLEALAVFGVIADAADYVGVAHGRPGQWRKADLVFGTEIDRVLSETVEIARQRISEHKSAAARKRWGNHVPPIKKTPEEIAQARSEAMKRQWTDPEIRERRLARLRDPEVIARLSDAAKRQWADRTPEQRTEQTRAARRHLKGGHSITRIEARVIQWLGEHDIAMIPHKEIGGYVMDIYVPSHRLDVEADGSQFHDETTAEREQARDAALAAEGITVLRLTEAEIKSGDFSRLHEALGV